MIFLKVTNHPFDLGFHTLRCEKILQSFGQLSGRVGIIKGTFDPFHNGHLSAARACIDYLKLDSIVFCPHSLNRRKTPSLINHRLEMIASGIREYHALFCSPILMELDGLGFLGETQRGTITLMKSILGQSNGRIEPVLIGGSDRLEQLSRFATSSDNIIKLCSFAAVAREGGLIDPGLERLRIVSATSTDISSNHIKTMLSEGKFQSLDGYLPRGVIEYLSNNNLYYKQYFLVECRCPLFGNQIKTP